jgi:phosphatidylserine/phosphatidylglycerophosphate/cardiolipin synthase-like enzyme
VLVVLTGTLAVSDRKPPALEDGIAVYFSPDGGCTDAIVEQIGKADKTIMLQAYSFTSARIAEALVDAHKRGVKVTAILDSSQRTAKYTSATFLHNQGVATFTDAKHGPPIAHNKIILIDDRTIITGSFNFSKAAEESNAENLLIIQGKAELFQAYERTWL